MEVLHLQNPGTPRQVYERVKRAYWDRYRVVWLQPFGFDNSNAVAVRENFANEHKLVTISDLVPLKEMLSIGVPPGFMERADAFPGLKRVYGLNFGDIRQMDPGLMYRAIQNKQVNVILAFSTDGRIPYFHLLLLKDDKHLFPPYYAAPVVRGDVLKKHPELRAVFQKLAGLIDGKTMRKLNHQADVDKRSPALIAKQFLKEKGLLDNTKWNMQFLIAF